ncbi:MAG: hypothetical protein EOS21_31760 [Mesorhizobium sp.]|uniref:hypothetical protein n=1 Tax=Mesorhizobium sp. TaxID=1871066 RepID=UPI000FE4D897|nr:hypothetical protein [Mesorhizobium sp.]RWN32562.1 MAG: hypothetical protein EOR95_16420 [Mesorhizobium sp.]RWQ31751.1 MAG: hypothetical protein EOS21_31760 [Mesorhizobium sp.]
MLASRGTLDAAQVKAAERFRALWEAMGGKGLSSIDPARIVVDGGKMPDGISQGQHYAGQELRKCRALLGVRGISSWRLFAAKEDRSMRSPAEISGSGSRWRICCAGVWTILQGCGE